MFSEMVDNVVQKTGRRAAQDQVNIIGYVRQVMRECQMLAFFERDMTEDLLIADAEPFNWTRPQNFRRMLAVAYRNTGALNGKIYPEYLIPGKRQRDHDYLYYAGPNYFTFKGIGKDGEIEIAYFSYFRRYIYYAAGTRPAVYDWETEAWSYLQPDGETYGPSLATPELEEEARDKVTNWLLTDWGETIAEGTSSKIFTAIDDPRAPKIFRSYVDMQNSLLDAEAVAAIRE